MNILDLQSGEMTTIFGYLEFSDLLVLRQVNQCLKGEVNNFLASIDHIKLIPAWLDVQHKRSSSFDSPPNPLWVERHLSKWSIPMVNQQLAACFKFLAKYCSRMAYVDAHGFGIMKKDDLLLLSGSLKYFRVSYFGDYKLDAQFIANNFPHLIDFDIKSRCICPMQFYQLYSQMHPGQFITYSNLCIDPYRAGWSTAECAGGCCLYKPDHPVARLCIGLPEDYSFLRTMVLVPSILNSIQVIHINEISEDQITQSFEGCYLPNLRQFRLPRFGPVRSSLRDLILTLSRSHTLESVQLPSSFGNEDERILRSVLHDWPNLQVLEYGQRFGYQIAQINIEDQYPIIIGPKMRGMKFFSKVPIILSSSHSSTLRALSLHGPLHDQFTINFPNLTTFKFVGPIIDQELRQALHSLISVLGLRDVVIQQDNWVRSRPDHQLGQDLVELLLTNHSIRFFEVSLFFAPHHDPYRPTIDLSTLSSLEHFEWKMENFFTQFVLPPGITNIEIGQCLKLESVLQNSQAQLRWSRHRRRKFNIYSTAISTSDQELSPDLKINFICLIPQNSLKLLIEMCAKIVILFPKIKSATFSHLSLASLPLFHLMLNDLLKSTCLSQLSIDPLKMTKYDCPMSRLLLPLVQWNGRSINLSISSGEGVVQVLLQDDQQFITTLLRQGIISKFQCRLEDLIWESTELNTIICRNRLIEF